MRNLTKSETQKLILAFGERLKKIKINNKELVTSCDHQTFFINENLTFDEIKSSLKLEEDNLLAFIRQLFIRSSTGIIKEITEDRIANIPVVSFLLSNNIIQMNY